MKKLSSSRHITTIEIMGFLAVIIMLWLDELIDIPHLVFGAPKTPVNIIESLFETLMAAALCFIVVTITHRLLNKMKVMEGILPICSFCKRIRTSEKTWVAIESYIGKSSNADFSHTVCPDCMRKHYDDSGDIKTP